MYVKLPKSLEQKTIIDYLLFVVSKGNYGPKNNNERTIYTLKRTINSQRWKKNRWVLELNTLGRPQP